MRRRPRFLAACPAVTLHGYIRAGEEVANALKEAAPRVDRSGADHSRGKRRAIVDHADAGIAGTRFTIGPDITTMTDREIIDVFNGIVRFVRIHLEAAQPQSLHSQG